MSILKHYQKYTEPVQYSVSDGILYWQEKIFLNIIYTLLFFGGVAYFPSVIVSVISGLWSIVIIDTAAYLFLVIIYFSKNKTLRWRVMMVLGLIYLLSVTLLLMLGMAGAGFLWMFIIPILASALLDQKAANIALVFNSVSLLVILGIVKTPAFPVFLNVFDYNAWIAVAANFLFLNVVTTLVVTRIRLGLREMLSREKDITSSLRIHQAELIKEKEKAEYSDRLKSEFLAQMSHEIRTPVSVLINFVDLVKNEGDNLDEDIRDFVPLALSAGKRIVRTVDLILNMAEIQAGTYEPRFQKVDLCELAGKEFSQFRGEAKSKNLKYTFTDETSDCVLSLDLHSVSHIVSNLIDNAIKYTPGGGEITLRLHQEDNDRILLSVYDTGIGIDREFLPHLFSIFSQEQQGYTREYEGTGLGLTLVKEYCELNNARITVESEKGKGSVFTIVFTRP